jgi:hypothetical protein
MADIGWSYRDAALCRRRKCGERQIFMAHPKHLNVYAPFIHAEG